MDKIEIKKIFSVNGKLFNSIEDAERYLNYDYKKDIKIKKFEEIGWNLVHQLKTIHMSKTMKEYHLLLKYHKNKIDEFIKLGDELKLYKNGK